MTKPFKDLLAPSCMGLKLEGSGTGKHRSKQKIAGVVWSLRSGGRIHCGNAKDLLWGLELPGKKLRLFGVVLTGAQGGQRCRPEDASVLEP